MYRGRNINHNAHELDPFGGICGAQEGYETTEVRDVQRTGGGVGCVRGHEKKCMGCFLDDLRDFGFNAD